MWGVLTLIAVVNNGSFNVPQFSDNTSLNPSLIRYEIYLCSASSSNLIVNRIHFVYQN